MRNDQNIISFCIYKNYEIKYNFSKKCFFIIKETDEYFVKFKKTFAKENLAILYIDTVLLKY